MKRLTLRGMLRVLSLTVLVLVAGLQRGMAQRYHDRDREQPGTYSDGGSQETGFNKENLFVGGGLSLGFGSYNFNLGATPEIGYSLNRWLDAGLALNINYYSERADPYFNDNIRTRSFNYGAGVFGRFWPVNFLFLQVQPEYNFIDYHLKDMYDGSTANAHTHAASLLTGIGYGQRFVGQSSFFVSVSIDVLNAQYSPYRDYNGTVLPVIRGGFDIYLHKRR